MRKRTSRARRKQVARRKRRARLRGVNRRALKLRLLQARAGLISLAQLAEPIRELTLDETRRLNAYRRRHGQAVIAIPHAERLAAWKAKVRA